MLRDTVLFPEPMSLTTVQKESENVFPRHF